MAEPIVCKPTRWFLLRALAMVVMFGVFAVMFYRDGSSGYREKNLSYYSWKGVEAAAAGFAARQAEMSPTEWRAFAAKQEIPLPEDRSVLPADTPETLPWPDLLSDYDTVKAGLANPRKELFEPAMDELGLTKSPPEQAYDAGKIRDQWIVFWVCLALTLVSLFLLLRTLRRRMVLDGERFQPPAGPELAVDDLVRLDLRKWPGKGLALAWARDGKGGERRIRIDGLTYGGFRAEDGEPAERLMEALKARFSGELIEYRDESGGEADPVGADA